jgi:hypothetical protein
MCDGAAGLGALIDGALHRVPALPPPTSGFCGGWAVSVVVHDVDAVVTREPSATSRWAQGRREQRSSADEVPWQRRPRKCRLVYSLVRSFICGSDYFSNKKTVNVFTPYTEN